MNDLRTTIHSAYSFIRSVESNKAAASLTLDHLIQDHIKRLKKGETTSVIDSRGESVGARTSRWDQLDALEQELNKVVEAMKSAGDDPEKLQALGLTEEETA